MANVNRTKVITGKNTRLSYFHGWEPVSINGGAEKYSVSVLIPKDDTETINAINAAVMLRLRKALPSSAAKSLTRALLSCLFVTAMLSVTMTPIRVTTS